MTAKDLTTTAIDALDLPGSPWHTVKTDIFRKLLQKLNAKAGFHNEYRQVGRELEKGTSTMAAFHSDGTAKIDDKETDKKRKTIKALLSIAAREAGCYPDVISNLNQSKDCLELTRYIQDVLTLNHKSLFESDISPQQPKMPSNDKLIEDGQVESLGTVLSQILEKDSKQLLKISLRLRDRAIPLSLRKAYYRMAMKHIAEDKTGLSKNDESARKEFANMVKSGMAKLGVKDPTKSPVQHLIQTTVIESYETLPGLLKFSKDMKFQKMSAAVLNIVFSCTQKFKYEFGLWLFPIQIAAPGDGSKEHMFELAMQLDTFTKFCFKFSHSNKISIDVWNQLVAANYGKDIVQHFQMIGIDISPDKVKNFLETDVASAADNSAYHFDFFKLKVNKSNTQTSHSPSTSRPTSFFAIPHPIVCIRQWIRHLFIGFTDYPVAMLLFDQFFLHLWDHTSIIKACLCLIVAISDSLLRATTVEDVCKAMVSETQLVRVHDFYVIWKRMTIITLDQP